ncbi:MAG: adenylate/guanylate cyclase domain-containing protein, partial [Hyphomicrobiaceae bacterium]
MAIDVHKLLEGLGLGHHAQLFADNDIDADVLPHVSDQDLKELGLSLGHRRKLLTAIVELRTAAQTVPPISAGPELPRSTTATGATALGLAGERRQVTVLFADLAGYTRLTSELDAEETHALLNRYFDAADTIVKNYAGTIDKHIGDAVMAVFGAPVAHDDDPERAIRASLDIHAAVTALNPPLSVHIGIASGQVIASGTGSETHSEYTVTGDSVNLASRLTELAGPGQTFVSEAVRTALEDRLHVAAIGETPIKGLSQPVKVWRVNGLQPADKTAHRRIAGRKTEIRQFESMIAACLETATGQVIYVRGEPGIGKTRLLAEFQSLAEGNGFTAHTGLVLDFGVGNGQDAVRALVRSLLGLRSGSDEAKRAQMAERAFVDDYLHLERRVYLNDLLDLKQPPELHALYEAMDNTARNRGKQDTVAELVQSTSARYPLFLAVEDIHWAGNITRAHLASIAQTVGDCPTLLVMSSRIDGDPIDQTWRAAAGNCPLVTFDLGPLREAEALELAENYPPADKQFVLSCIARAEGNPLFLE